MSIFFLTRFAKTFYLFRRFFLPWWEILVSSPKDEISKLNMNGAY